MPEGNLRAALRLLSGHRIDCVLVGGLAAVLHGVPVNTCYIDIAHCREPANLQRLLSLLETLDAIFRIQAEQRRLGHQRIQAIQTPNVGRGADVSPPRLRGI
jgi:hypothetical protein